MIKNGGEEYYCMDEQMGEDVEVTLGVPSSNEEKRIRICERLIRFELLKEGTH